MEFKPQRHLRSNIVKNALKAYVVTLPTFVPLYRSALIVYRNK